MDKDLDCYKKMIARLDIRINKLLKMRKNITIGMMHLIISEEEAINKPTGAPDDIMGKIPALDQETTVYISKQ